MFDIPGLGVPELILLLVLALIIFGPGKLPDIGRSMGKAINEFKQASKEITPEHRPHAPQEVVVAAPDAAGGETQAGEPPPQDTPAPH